MAETPKGGRGRLPLPAVVVLAGLRTAGNGPIDRWSLNYSSPALVIRSVTLVEFSFAGSTAGA